VEDCGGTDYRVYTGREKGGETLKVLPFVLARVKIKSRFCDVSHLYLEERNREEKTSLRFDVQRRGGKIPHLAILSYLSHLTTYWSRIDEKSKKGGRGIP